MTASAATPAKEGNGLLQELIEAGAAVLPPGDAADVRRSSFELAAFLGLLRRANESTNLVSSKAAAPEELVSRHLLDSLLALPFLPPPSSAAGRLLDIGSGGGFPAVPLLIVRRDLAATLVESTGKKCAFLRDVCGRLSLTAGVVNARFPDSFDMRGPARYDVLTSRAVASAGRLVRAARPLLTASARALLWSTERLFAAAARECGAKRSRFVRAPGAEVRGIGILWSFT